MKFFYHLLFWAIVVSTVVFSDHCFITSSKQYYRLPASSSFLGDESCFQHAWSFEVAKKLDEVYERELNDFIHEGNSRIIHNGDFPFRLGPNRNAELGGYINDGIWFVEDEVHGKIVVKGLGSRKNNTASLIQDNAVEILTEIRNAKAMHMLGIGPRVYLVEVKGKVFLIAEEVPGINIKEIALSGFQTLTTKQRIAQIIGGKYSTHVEARASYARALLKNVRNLDQMRRVAMILEKHNYTVRDFQFMIHPAINGNNFQLSVIDVAGFTRGVGQREIGIKSPTEIMEHYIRRLEHLALLFPIKE